MVEPGALVGQVVDGRWLLVDHLGSGQFGDVYSAEPRHLELSVGAVKVVRPRNDEDRRQILREIRALAELSHDGLLGYRDSGEIHEGVLAGGIYLVTELCDGALSDEPRWGGSSDHFRSELARAIGQVAEALGYLHDRGFIHRDVKPANILRAGDTWKLSDFGLVRGPSEPPPAAGSVQGTAPYLAPETSAAAGAGPPADIYALGVVVHEALSGAWPYDSPEGRWSGPPINEGAVIRISPVVPDEWRPLLELCLDRDPKRRPKAAELAALIPDPTVTSFVNGPAPVRSRTQTVDTLPPPRGPTGRAKTVLAVVGTVIVAAIATILLVTLNGGDGDDPDSGRALGAAPAPAVEENPPDSQLEDPGTDPEAALDEQLNWIDDAGVLNVFADLTLEADQSAPVLVRSDDVVVDCAGHTISGMGTGDLTANGGRGINVEGRTGVEIMNCFVTNFFTGVFIGRDSTEIVVRDSTAHGNGEGFRVDTSSASLSDNTATDNDMWGFILFDGTAGSLLERNVAEDNRAVGFGILNSSDNGLDSNRATGNDINFSLGAADDNRLTDNVAQGGSEGFFISGSDNNIFAGNSAIGGSSSAGGFILDGSSGNAFTGNTATGYRLGFNTSRVSSDNTFDANLASDNDQGFVDRGALGAGTSGTNNTYLDNTCSGNEFASIPPGLCPRE